MLAFEQGIAPTIISITFDPLNVYQPETAYTQKKKPIHKLLRW
jgi:hypothetical protein